jgi:glutathione S-transferase
MVKLYYTPTSCGASSFISAFIAGIKLDCEIVDLTTHLTESGVDFYTINPKGNVPTLILDDGTILNENIACLEYILDLSLQNKEGYKLGPNNNTSDRYIVRQYLSFIASELHPVIGLFFNPAIKKDMYIRKFLLEIFYKKLKYLESYMLKDKKFVYGNSFTIVDAYLQIVLGWTGYVGIDINKYKDVLRYKEYIESIPIVKKAKNRMAFFPKTTI